MAILQFHLSYSQTNKIDSSRIEEMIINEVIISANKVEESKKNIAQQVQSLSLKEIENTQSLSTADVLLNSGNVFVQKSQMGGGSPVIRGFEASRILLVVDGVRMNNLIYRAGHLQNITTLDNNMLDRIEILFGPSSTVYGSDALGGVIHLFTKKPILSNNTRLNNIKVNASTRYSSAANVFTGHLDFNLGYKKFASITSFTYSKFDHLRAGKNQNPFYKNSYGERPYYAERINGKDSLLQNSNPYIQIHSGYSQYDLLQKFLYQQNKHISHGINIQFSNSGNIPRYDRLTDPNGADLAYADWYYGPQQRLMTSYDMNIKKENAFFQNIHFGVNYQNIEESRHSRKFNNNNLLHRIENVNVFGSNLDFQKIAGASNFRFGMDGQFNTLKSTANSENIETNERLPLDTRYPDGNNTMLNAAIYLSHTWSINNSFILTDGIRAGFSMLHSTFVDTTFYQFPYTSVSQNNAVISGTIGLINNPSDNWKLSLLLSTGFRVPNVDDLSKIFESAQGKVIVPNPDLKPEKTINYELGISRFFNNNAIWENTIFYTQFIDAIVTDKFQFNRQDSILYDGSLSQVYANQNKRIAFLYGFSSKLKSEIGENFRTSILFNYTYGRIVSEGSKVPLDHIPPLMAWFQIAYDNKKFSSEFLINCNAWKKLYNYNLNGEDNEQYATPEGMPAWIIANIHFSYKMHKLLTIQTGIDNILDTQYRTFASGINAAGRNIFLAIRFKL